MAQATRHPGGRTVSCNRVAYERAFAALVGARASRAFAMGRQGLVVLLRALGVEGGQRVGICGYSCLSVAEAVKVAGGTPVYLDVDEQLCIDPAALRRLEPGALDVLILQHTFGGVGQLDALLAEAGRIGVAVVEDNCHALGTQYRGEPVGHFGVGAIYSFQWGKSYSTGQGGMLTVQDADLLAKVDRVIERLARPASAKADALLAAQRTAYAVLGGPGAQATLRNGYHKLTDLGLVRGSFSAALEFALHPGYVRLAGLRMCRAGLEQLRKWPASMAARRHAAERIQAVLDREGIATWPVTDGCEPILLRYPMRASNKTALLAAASRQGLNLAGWYDSPVHPLTGEQLRQVDYEPGTCPRAERAIRRIVHLPTGPTFTDGLLRAAVRLLATVGSADE